MAVDTSYLNSVYNHYLTSYAPKSSSRYDSHKKSELRTVYNSMVKLNKDSPLYILDNSKDTRQYAISLKEEARSLHNTIASLGGVDEEALLNKKIAYSTNPDIASAKYIGEDNASENVPTLDIEVKGLASPQVNTGDFLPQNGMGLSPDTYSFDIAINDLNYEFQYNVSETDTNLSTQNKLARLISNSGIGLEADVLDDGNGNSALRMRSASTGLMDGKSEIFHVSDEHTSKASGSVNYFGLNDMTSPASNATFVLNGSERSTASNNFTIEHMYEINLNGISSEGGDSTSIGLKTDVESLSDNIGELVNGYNKFITTASSYQEAHPKSTQLLNEMQNITTFHQADLSSLGLNMDTNGIISIDKNALEEAATSGDLKERFSSIKNFTNSLLRKSNAVSLNPMNYVDKTVVAYKNPGKTFPSPYVTSAYSGMMFNSYC